MFLSVFWVQVAVALVLFVLSTFMQRLRESLFFYIAGWILVAILFYFEFRFFPQGSADELAGVFWMYALVAISIAVYVPFFINFLRFFSSDAFSLMLNKDALKYEKTYAKAKQLERQGELGGAMKIYQHYIDNDEKDVQARINLCKLYQGCKSFEKAVECLRPAILYAEDQKEKLRLSFWLVEIILNEMKDVKLALNEIEFLKLKYKGTEYENAVKKKIQVWKFQKFRQLKGG